MTDEQTTQTGEITLTRRDMIEVETVAGKSFTRLFPDGEATALGTLAVAYVQSKKSGETDLDWEAWLDEDFADGDVSGEDENPT